MPLQTPSPHRFLAPAAPGTQTTKHKPRSGLHQVATAHTPKPAAFDTPGTHDEVARSRVTPAKRFVLPSTSSRSPLNYANRSTEGDHVDGSSARPQAATPRPKPRLSKVESIDSTSPSSSANKDVHDVLNFLPSMEQFSTPAEDGDYESETEEEEILFIRAERHKRRRVSPGPSTPLHAQRDPSSPHQQSSPQIASPVSHRFKNPGPSAATPLKERQTNARPHFILPQPFLSPTKSSVPLPETFSPSRKIGKYVPNGMASTFQSWVHETASTGYAATSSSAIVWGKDKEDGVKVRVEVLSVARGQGAAASEVECWPGRVVFIRGISDATALNLLGIMDIAQTSNEGNQNVEVKVVLAGQGGTREKGGVRVREGDVVGLRAPIWDVRVGQGAREEGWIVGVEWVVL